MRAVTGHRLLLPALAAPLPLPPPSLWRRERWSLAISLRGAREREVLQVRSAAVRWLARHLDVLAPETGDGRGPGRCVPFEAAAEGVGELGLERAEEAVRAGGR